jgi:hypothetical protein
LYRNKWVFSYSVLTSGDVVGAVGGSPTDTSLTTKFVITKIR